MTPDFLRRAGEALYGPQWQSELARALDVNGRTVRRWAAGDTAIPDWLAARLLELIAAHDDELDEVWSMLRHQAASTSASSIVSV